MKAFKGIVLFLLVLLTAFAATAEGWQFVIEKEDTLIEDAGVTAHEWETAVAERRQTGLQNQVTAEDILAADAEAQMKDRNGSIYYISGKGILGAIDNAYDAYERAYSLVTLLGGADETTLNLWSVLTTEDVRVYNFQQVHDGLTVVASTLKIITDGTGSVNTVFSSLSGSDPVTGTDSEITAKEAEAVVETYLKENGQETPVLSEYTGKAIIPIIDFDDDSDEMMPDMIVWVVYTSNTRMATSALEEMPYIAHYVQMDGTYLYSNPVTVPQDMAGSSGYQSAYAFDGMEADSWTGEITTAKGKKLTVTVPVMKETKTGRYYLGDAERKIIFAEFAPFYYEEGKIEFFSKEENEWDDSDVLALYNYIRAYDFYAQVGWIGPDGTGTPTLILRNLCQEDGTPMENACYVGKINGWQTFAYCEEGNLVDGLDVMAHEFTHCVTSTVMNTNLYQDDLGAINEAMSDIMGNICEYTYGDTTDKEWLIGENTGEGALRSMSNPHRYQQPDYVWDVYYVPHADKPNDINDRGGVHTNSSLLNRIAAKLCIDDGMSYEEARNFWLMTAFGMTPRMDYPQIPELLQWALEASGNSRYQASLDELLGEEILTRSEIPDTFPEGTHLAILELPEGETFDDPNWTLFVFQLDTDEIHNRLTAILELIGTLLNTDEDADFEAELSDVMSRLHLDGLNLSLEESEDGEENPFEEAIERIVSGLITQHTTWKAAGTNYMPIVLNNQLSVYALINIDTSDYGIHGLAILLGEKWLEIWNVDDEDNEAMTAAMEEVLSDENLDSILSTIVNAFLGIETDTPQKEMLPTDGLERINVHEEGLDMTEDEAA